MGGSTSPVLQVCKSLHRVVLALLLVLSAWGQALAETFELSAPPDLDPAESRALYTPLMDLLSRETGETFVYVHSDSWFAYQNDIRAGRFELLLDDAHIASWRIAVLDHVPLVRAREQATFVIIAIKDGRIYSKEDLVGRPVCAPAPPALGTVGFLALFDGLFQVPRILETPDPLDRVQNVLIGDCDAAMLARHQYTGSDEIRSVAGQLKIVTQTDSYPGLTLTAGPGVPDELRGEIQTILLSRAGGNATRALRDRLANGSSFIEADPGEYAELHGLLRDYPGFNY